MRVYFVTAGLAAICGASTVAILTGWTEIFAWALVAIFLVKVMAAAGRAKRARS